MMRELLPILILLLGSPCWATWTLTQAKDNTSCSTSPCTVTVTSTSSGHAGAVAIISGNTTAATITGVTAGACAVAWIHCPNCSLANTTGNVDISYCPNLTGSSTSIAISTSATLSLGIGVFWEAASTLGTVAIDAGATPSGTKANTVACTSCAGVVLTLSGNNDFIVSVSSCGGSCTGVTGTGWTNDLTSPNGDNISHGITSGSQTAPATIAQSSGAMVTASLSLQETSGAAAPSGFNKRQKIEQLERGN